MQILLRANDFPGTQPGPKVAIIDSGVAKTAELDPLVIAEKGVMGGEYTVGIIGRGDDMVALPIIKIEPATEWYDYEAKYNRDDTRYLLARALQFFLPGVPQVYYVGLLAGQNDTELMHETGEAREINRHHYSLDEAEEALQAPVVQRLLSLMELRSTHPAFAGEFELHQSNMSSVSMGWRAGAHSCHLFVDLNFRTATVTCTDPDSGEETSFRC